jgi:hypothetical protein
VWKGSKIVSRVLPYPDFVSLFVRLPIAHAIALGEGVKAGVLQMSEGTDAQVLIQNIAPRARIEVRRGSTNTAARDDVLTDIVAARWRVALIADPAAWPGDYLVNLTEQLRAKDVLVVVPADLAEEDLSIATVNRLAAAGALTVGRVNRQSLLLPSIEGRAADLPFNRRIAEIRVDVFSTSGIDSGGPPITAAATAAGVAALVAERWPQATAHEVREKVLKGARPLWQMVKPPTPLREIPFTVDPVTTEFKPKDEEAVFRFRALDAAGAVEVDTELPWFLNLLNCQKAWEITRGQGARVLVTDQGFHLRHPTLASRIESQRHFGPRTFDTPEQNFHGTDMTRIVLAIAPEVRIVPVLCSGESQEELTRNIAASFRYAVEVKADVVSASWAGWFNSDTNVLGAVRETVDHGLVVSWFHYPKAYPGLLRPSFTYASGWDPEPRLGFADRFYRDDPPGVHPAEIQAGLSATAPQAAGIAALVRSVNPRLRPDQVERLLFENATTVGAGLVIPDAGKTVLAAKQTAP